MTFGCRRKRSQARRRERAQARARSQAAEIIRLACACLPDPWLLPDDEYAADGRIDRQAVEVAVYGVRRVRLTNGERMVAATAIIRHGGTVRMVCVRLSLPSIVPEGICRPQPRIALVLKIAGSTPG